MGEVKVENLGLSFNRFVNDVDIYCWDLDGTLGVYAFGRNGVDSCNDAYYQDYLKEHNPYKDIKPCKLVQKFIQRFTNKEDNYVITVAQSDLERRYKLGFILENFGDKISVENIIFVESKTKKFDALRDIENKRSTRKICLIDDTVSTLSDIEATSLYRTVHISSFMAFEELFN